MTSYRKWYLVSYVWRMLQEAAIVSRLKRDDRRFYIGAIGLRSDGTKVIAWNGNPKEPTREHHCEYRLSRKLDRGSTVFLARTVYSPTGVNSQGLLANSRPCPDCEKVLRYRGVRKVYYTISEREYGVLYL